MKCIQCYGYRCVLGNAGNMPCQNFDQETEHCVMYDDEGHWPDFIETERARDYVFDIHATRP